jgi:hypothetical protein
MTLPWGASSRDELKEGMWVLVGDALIAPREKKQIKEIRREVRRDGTPLYGHVSQTMTATVFFTDGTSAGEDVHIQWTGVAFNDDGWVDADGFCDCGETRLAMRPMLFNRKYLKIEDGSSVDSKAMFTFKCRSCGEEYKL